MKMKLIIFFALLSTICCRPDSTILELKSNIENILPSRWTIISKQNTLEITRKDSVYIYGGLSSMGNPTDNYIKKFGQKRRIQIFIELEETDSIKEQKLYAEYINIKLEKDSLVQQMENMGIRNKNEFFPSNKKEEKLVMKYRTLLKKIPKLPQFHYMNYSIFYSDSFGGWNNYYDISPDSVSNEINSTKRKIIGLLKKST